MEEELDRRLFNRFTARFPTKFKDSSQDYGAEVFLRDVSATGARLATHSRMLIDDVLSLSVLLPDGRDPVQLNGRVRWVHGHAPQVWEVGMQFTKIDLMNLHRIVKYSMPSSESSEKVSNH
ncbi:MAG: PilZ domain-containing protein [Candidatus Omnitrophica bacterium]|nr:PilZ domain-containing protein [Candidatus Omnitrophota bacterium]